MRQLLVCVAICFIVCSCGQSIVDSADRMHHVDIEPQEVAVEDLFDRIEVVPLETNDSALIYHIYNSCVIDSDIYVQDFRAMVVYRFGTDGKFKNRIGRRGQGPGEFTLAYGFDIDSDKNRAYIVSAHGKVYEYSLSGEFVRDYELPSRLAYDNIKIVDDSTFMTWSGCSFEELPGAILGSTFDSVLYVPQLSNHLADNLYAQPSFFRADNVLHVGQCYNRRVYAVTRDSASVEYEWDFGKNNVPDEALAKHDIKSGSDNADTSNDPSDKFRADRSITSYLYGHNSNDLYDYVTFRDDSKFDGDNDKRIHYKVFHDKRTGKNIVFDKLSNGMMRRGPMEMTEDYLLYKIPWKELPLYEQYLPEGMKLSDIDPDDDNPVLARFYFKK